MVKDPVLHSHVEDVLPDSHPLAYESVYCRVCGQMLHAFNNECMQTWVETGKGNYCLACLNAAQDSDAMDDDWGLET